MVLATLSTETMSVWAGHGQCWCWRQNMMARCGSAEAGTHEMAVAARVTAVELHLREDALAAGPQLAWGEFAEP